MTERSCNMKSKEDSGKRRGSFLFFKKAEQWIEVDCKITRPSKPGYGLTMEARCRASWLPHHPRIGQSRSWTTPKAVLWPKGRFEIPTCPWLESTGDCRRRLLVKFSRRRTRLDHCSLSIWSFFFFNCVMLLWKYKISQTLFIIVLKYTLYCRHGCNINQ